MFYNQLFYLDFSISLTVYSKYPQNASNRKT